MSDSHVIFKFITCLCLLAGTVSFSGCEKVPTWDDLTSEEKDEGEKPKPQAKPAKPDVVVKRKPKPKPKKVVVKVEPEEAYAAFQEMRSRDINDLHIDKLIKEMGDKASLVEKLNLGHSRVTIASIKKMNLFTSLKELNASGIELNDEAVEVIGQLTQLESLNLDGNRTINSDRMIYLEGLVNLRRLSLNNTAISENAFAAMRNLDNLEYLSFIGTNITGEGFYKIRKRKSLKKLRHINANNTSFGVYGFAGIQGLTELRTLNVRTAIVSDPSLKGLKGLKKLTKLDLGFNTLSDVGVKEITKNKSLVDLNLHNTKRITNEGLRLMLKLKNLEVLTLTGTMCNPAGAKAFKKKVKDCKVLLDGEIY